MIRALFNELDEIPLPARPALEASNYVSFSTSIVVASKGSKDLSPSAWMANATRRSSHPPHGDSNDQLVARSDRAAIAFGGVFAFKGGIRSTFNDVRGIHTVYDITAPLLITAKKSSLISKRINESNSKRPRPSS